MPAPFIYHANNPFSSERRSYAVEYGYAISSNEEITLTLDEGITIEELPKRSKRQAQRLRYSNFWMNEGNTITINRIFQRRENTFQPSKYGMLRELLIYAEQSDQNEVVFTIL